MERPLHTLLALNSLLASPPGSNAVLLPSRPSGDSDYLARVNARADKAARELADALSREHDPPWVTRRWRAKPQNRKKR